MLAIEAHRDQATVRIESERDDSALLGFQANRNVALRGVRDVDDRQRNAAGGEAIERRADGLVAGGHRIHVVRALRAPRGHRHIQHVDGRIVDVVVEHVLDAPAHRRLELLGLDRRRLDQKDVVFLRLEQRGAAEAFQAELARHALEGLGLGRLPRPLLGEFDRGLAALRHHVREAHRGLAELEREPAWRRAAIEKALGDARHQTHVTGFATVEQSRHTLTYAAPSAVGLVASIPSRNNSFRPAFCSRSQYWIWVSDVAPVIVTSTLSLVPGAPAW